MRKTLHEFVVEQSSKYITQLGVNTQRFAGEVLNYTYITKRRPKLSYFVPCDEAELPIYKPEQSSFNMLNPKMVKEFERVDKQYQQALSRVIFKGDWQIKEVPNQCLLLKDKGNYLFFSKVTGRIFDCNRYEITRIEDLPKEIEFKEDVI